MSDTDWSWDADNAERLEGATILVGMTYDDPAGQRNEQFYGTAMVIDQREGITLRLEGHREGEIFQLPPDLSAFEPASPGRYTLRGSGDVVVDPDFITTWTITPPKG